MSCVIGVVLKNKIAVCADQGRYLGENKFPSSRYANPAKLVIKGLHGENRWIIGIAGMMSWRMAIEELLTGPNKLDQTLSKAKTMPDIARHWRMFREYMTENELIDPVPKDGQGAFCSRFIFANPFGLWEIDGNGHPEKVLTCAAIGDCDAAEGALFALTTTGLINTENIQAKDVASIAVAAAINHSVWCDPPIVGGEILIDESILKKKESTILTPDKKLVDPTDGKPLRIAPS